MKSTPLTELKGVGPRTAELFLKIGVSSQEELLRCYPRDYDIFEEPVWPEAVRPGQKNAVMARVRQKPSVRRFGGNSITMLNLTGPGGSLQVNWFHMPYLRSTLHVGKDYVFRGTVIEKQGRRILQHPEVYEPEEYRALCRQMLPVYSLTEGLSRRTFRRVMKLVLDHMPDIPEDLPEELRGEEGLCGAAEAVRTIHFPPGREALLRARDRLVFEEFFFFQLAVAFLRRDRKKEDNHWKMPETGLADYLLRALPYDLTEAQSRVWQEISSDLDGPHLMYRLVQGDVGSGKTILAFLAMLRACGNGMQSALMAPTEVLATQHYDSLNRFLAELGLTDLRPVLLKGSLTAREKREADALIVSGQARLIIGTHALIQDAVNFRDLGLVITDEQHRFGVLQRSSLAGKGRSPHVLVMSATPIPRTLAMILYGDLDISILDQLPARRLPIQNAVVGTGYREAAFRFLEKETGNGHQAYVVCPAIEPGEGSDCENVMEYSARLRARFEGRITVDVLHGRMKAGEKQAVMERFQQGQTQILVSTTVIEVGIDVPNATVMLIENAERFGLAQLHQLRGRVGRGDSQSYCIFMQGNGREETARRLEILSHSNDGFYIAEEDLKLRGPGDLFGVRQSGAALFEIADPYRDAGILARADKAARKLLEQDPDLTGPGHARTRARMEEQLRRQESLKPVEQ